MNGKTAGTIKESLDFLTDKIHKNAISKGWWEEERSLPEILALIHSELSEALEEYRLDNPPIYGSQGSLVCTQDEMEYDNEYKDYKPEGIAIELADAMIRILDYCGHAKIDIGEAILMKMRYNEARPYRHGGKKC